jgi:hydrogen peroxide-dependent heme synthase
VNTSTTSTDSGITPALRPKEGWHVIHLFYRIDYASWSLLSSSEKLAAKTVLSSLVQEARSLAATQLLTFSMVTPKADLGFMLLTEDLHVANTLEKRITLSLGPEMLTPIFSFYSLTERSEYMGDEEEYRKNVIAEKGEAAVEEALVEYRKRIEKYQNDRLYPSLPDWPVFAFYPMSKRRVLGQNWYTLSFEERRQLMLGHARIGRQYAGKIRQQITGCTGLDDWEWGVSLFAHDVAEIKSIVYDMRFDPVSSTYAEFGEFFIGLQLPLDELFARLQL